MRPPAPARIPCSNDSPPRVGLTVRTDCRVSSTGSAPAFSCVARSFASCSAKPPVISPIPPVMADCTWGDEITTRSTTIAIWSVGSGEPTAAVVASANRSAPSLSNWKFTVQSDVPS